MTYPTWAFFPRQLAAPEWVRPFLTAVAQSREEIDSLTHRTLESDKVVAALRDALVELGWEIETGKHSDQKIKRPVLFGDNGVTVLTQELDGWHPGLKIIMEIESGRAIQGNAIYRDLVRASLVADADYLVLGVRQQYVYGAKDTKQEDFARARDIIDSVYASGRLVLPFRGLLLFGW